MGTCVLVTLLKGVHPFYYMDDLLYFRTAARNYKMTYKWICKICNKKTNHMMGSDSLQQVCSNRHITIPDKFCNKCGQQGHVNDIICPICEPEVVILAEKLLEEEKNGHN